METLGHHYRPIETADADVLIEVRGLYDGWSIALMKDGTIVNRWEPGDRRHAMAEKWILDYKARTNVAGEPLAGWMPHDPPPDAEP